MFSSARRLDAATGETVPPSAPQVGVNQALGTRARVLALACGADDVKVIGVRVCDQARLGGPFVRGTAFYLAARDTFGSRAYGVGVALARLGAYWMPKL